MSQPLTEQQLDEITESHPGDWYAGEWRSEYVEATGDDESEAAYYRVFHVASGAELATLPDWAGPIALFLADAHDTMPALLADLRRTRDRVAELERPAIEADTLPAWLYQRFMAGGVGWENLDDGDRAYWEHQARAVRRAVARGGFKTAPEATSALLAASQPSEACGEGETATRPPTGPLRDSDAARIALTRSDLAALLAHHADVLAARWRAVAPGAGAWEVAAALSLTSHANELSAEMERPAVTELLDNIWTFPLEQQDAATEEPAPRRTLTPNEYDAAWHAAIEEQQ